MLDLALRPIHWVQHLPSASLNLLFIVIGLLSALGIASDIWYALQVDEGETDDGPEADHVR